MPALESQPVTSGDHLPELPENPPTILSPLLEYTFKDLGMDKLNLIDLRSLDTPAPLGDQVIMIVGTARSVKHLNVSADRLCRWMRTNWKLSPYADGLLGRNELKIKLRRKARRAKAATLAGAIVDDKDDGITTGWICVNAGIVQRDAAPEPAEDQEIEGFGNISRGTRIVVQMFTEEKRAEVDLETLWEKRLVRAERDGLPGRSASSEASPGQVRDHAVENQSFPDSDSGHPSRPPRPFPPEQRRGLHTTRRLAMDANGEGKSMPGAGPPKVEVSLTALTAYLFQLPDERVRSELGTGPDDRESTVFLKLFYGGLADVSPSDIALPRLRLVCLAVASRHPGYSKESLYEFFLECIRSDQFIPPEDGLQVVSAMLTERSVESATGEPTVQLPHSDIELTMRVFEHLSAQNVNVLSMRVFNMLYRAARYASPATPMSEASIAAYRVELLARIPVLVEAFNIRFHPQESRTFMWALFQDKNYDGFWRLWKDIPRNDVSRKVDDYEQLFRAHAELGDGHRARECVAAWAPMMNKETPPVPRHFNVTEQIQACLKLPDPEKEKALDMQQSLLQQDMFDADETTEESPTSR